MKPFFYLLFALLPLQKIAALTITEVSVSNSFENEINISLTTEAVELYYFQSWQYSISETTITLEVLFIPGFGSKIAYLNNNFQIPLSITELHTYHLIVKVYYTFYKPENLQDTEEGWFETPLSSAIVLNNSDLVNKVVFFPNPTGGKVFINSSIKTIWIFDNTGKTIECLNDNHNIIDLSNRAEGLYIVTYFNQFKYKTVRIIVKK